MAGDFRRGDSTTSVETTDSDDHDPSEDDHMSAKEFEEFKLWLAADQPQQTPRKPNRESGVVVEGHPDEAVKVEAKAKETFTAAPADACTTCFKGPGTCDTGSIQRAY